MEIAGIRHLREERQSSRWILEMSQLDDALEPRLLERGQDDCICLRIEIHRYRRDLRNRVAAEIGYMLAYALQTDTEILAWTKKSQDRAYKLIFCFTSESSSADFLHLLRLNEITSHYLERILAPTEVELKEAQPIRDVLPEDLLHRIFELAAQIVAVGERQHPCQDPPDK